MQISAASIALPILLCTASCNRWVHFADILVHYPEISTLVAFPSVNTLLALRCFKIQDLTLIALNHEVSQIDFSNESTPAAMQTSIDLLLPTSLDIYILVCVQTVILLHNIPVTSNTTTVTSLRLESIYQLFLFTRQNQTCQNVMIYCMNW